MSQLVLGIDEAGRGCVIGSLFMAGFLIPEEDHLIDRLNSLGVVDSKLLLAKRRDALAEEIKKIAHGYKILKIKPNLIDEFSINQLEIQFSAKIISKLGPHKVYLDVPTSNSGIMRYCQAVNSLCSPGIKFIGANKMDDTNILVAAASILAKSERERQLKILKKKYGDFGSGYPSDPKTIKWLADWHKNNSKWPHIVRQKWATLNNFQFSNSNFQSIIN